MFRSLKKLVGAPHIYAKNNHQIMVDILVQDRIPDFYIGKFVDARNLIPHLKIYVGIMGELSYFFDVIQECSKNGFGIYKIDSDVKLLLETRIPTIDDLSEGGQMAIVSNRPYRNILALKRCFRNCNSYLYWFERNLPKKVFEVLYQAIEDKDIQNVENIKLLRVIDGKLNDAYRREFVEFRRELASKDVCAEMRIITDSSIARDFHGRYIYAVDENNQKFTFQIPPLNSLKANQWDSILKVKEVPSFEQLWSLGSDLKESWGGIKPKIKEFMKRKIDALGNEAEALRKEVES